MGERRDLVGVGSGPGGLTAADCPAGGRAAVTATATRSGHVQRVVFQTLNRVVEPVVRRGVGTTAAGPGSYVVETTGRRTGLPRRVPLLGYRIGNTIIASTVRDDSHWLGNLEHQPSARIWVAGCPRPVSATVVRLPRGGLAVLQPSTPPTRRNP